ncbi:MAG: hypothetical protein EOP04_28330 [Proteobacteria bacterium]|nr:MAG: hypothetical protein EOP04_28330 [Pseudomonadota bacterium]
MDWATYPSVLEPFARDFKPSCSSMEKLYLTDRRSRKSEIADKIYYPEYAARNKISSFDEFSAEKYVILQTLPDQNQIMLQNWGPELFIDTTSSEDPKSLEINYNNMYARSTDCRVALQEPKVIPTQATLNFVRSEAERLKGILEIYGTQYARTRQLRMLTKVQIERTTLVAESTERAIKVVLKTIFEGECKPLQFEDDPLLEGILLEEPEVPSETCKISKQPKDLNLALNSWNEFSAKGTKSVFLNATKDRYLVSPLGYEGAWLYEAKILRPNLGNTLELLIQQYADLLSIELVKDQLASEGIDVNGDEKSKAELEAAISQSWAFLGAFRKLSDTLKSYLDALESRLRSEEMAIQN